MSKKQILIDVLTRLIPYRELAEWFLVLVKETQDEDFIQSLFFLIKKQISTIKDKQEKQSIVSQIKKIKKVKSQEKDVTQKDKEEADKILDDLVDDKF